MTILHVFLALFVANLLGYGGGPSTIPLIQNQVVNVYHLMNSAAFFHDLALANALPGPIATKIAVYVGYTSFGWLGALVGLIATVVPSAIAVIILLQWLHHYKQSDSVKGMVLLIQPAIAVLMIVLTWNVGEEGLKSISPVHFVILAVLAWIALKKFRIHPAFVIVGAFLYGALLLR